MTEILGRCDKKQYEHCGPHPRYSDVGQRLPPFACANWKEDVAQTPLSEVDETLRAVQGDGQPCIAAARSGINRDSLTILDAGHGQKGTFFTVVHDGEHAFIHYQLPQGFMAFRVVGDAIGMIINNYLADVYEKEDNALNSLS